MRKILFVVYGGGHARLVRPVIDHLLRTSQDVEVICLALTTAVREFSGLISERFRILAYKDFFGQDAEVLSHGKSLVQKMTNIFDLDESIAYLGKNYLELIKQAGSHQKAAEIYEQGGRQVFLPIESMREIISLVEPDIVVTTNSPRSEKAALIAARSLNVRSVAIIDMFSFRCESWLVELADTVCVFDISVAERLRVLGRHGDIQVTGNPAFDTLVKRFNNNRNSLAKQKKILPFTVLWASQQEPEYVYELNAVGNVGLPIAVEHELIEVFSCNPDWQLIVRNHPNEEPRTYPSFVKISAQHQPLEELLKEVHVIVTLTSTVGLQGRIMGCQLVTIDGSAFTSTVPFAKIGYSIGLSSPSELVGELKRLASLVNKQPLASPPYLIENAAERVAHAILSI
ncbi:hypothetical protein ACF8EA_23740 [Pseudomonas sp. YQ_5]|uniref:hypothetical protein n=1 Tax=unclassified Pseudomonas TaxID=196821 RepID=UPI00244D5672|nr:hypothetical protein [Pseudomonas sp. GD03696]MDH1933100.1 hypothetical protein [Pseudomonas sp. GD03696]